MLYRKISISGAIVNCLQGPAIISMKSIVNKIIPAQELGEYRYLYNSHTYGYHSTVLQFHCCFSFVGQVSAVTGIGENVIPIFCGPLYSYVYESTVDFFPSAYFLVTAVITVPTIFLYL